MAALVISCRFLVVQLPSSLSSPVSGKGAAFVFHHLTKAPRRGHSQNASVLLEVVLALALFIGAATVISAGISASVEAVHRVRLQTHAANLAISIMSELQIGARPLVAIGPELLEAPFQEWLYRIDLNDSEAAAPESSFSHAVEVIVWHTQESAVHRVTQHFRATELAAAQDKEGIQ